MKRQNAYLTDHFFASYGLWQVVGVFGLLQSSILVIYVLGTAVFFACVWLDRRSLLRGQQLHAHLHMPRALELEQPVHLQATLVFLQENPLMPGRIEWEAPRLAAFHFNAPQIAFRPSDASHTFTAQHSAIAIGLGYMEWTSLQLVVRSRWRLWFQKLDVDIVPQEVRVHPSFRRISEQDFVEHIANQNILTQGSRRILRGRAADQFHSIRRYQYPDSFRHIDARKSAKYARLMTRIYDEYRAHHLVMALDLGRSMCGRLKASSKHDYYLSACLMLAQHAIAAGDEVSFFAFSNTTTFSVRGTRHLAGFEPLFKGDQRLQAQETESRFDLLYPTVCSLTGQRSIVLVLTDLTSPSVQQALLEALAPICRRHLTFAVGLQDNRFFLDHLVWGSESNRDREPDHDPARLFYAYWLNDRFRLFRQQMARLGGGMVQGSDETWISLVVQVYSQLRDSLHA